MCSIAASTLLACILFASTYFTWNRRPVNNGSINIITTTEFSEQEVNPKDLESEVWFFELGTFPIGQPWRSLMRPVPPPMGPEDNEVVIHCYSWRNKVKPYIITLHPEIHLGGTPFDGRRPSAIIIHGYRNNITNNWLIQLKDAYLEHVDGNVFLVDWGPGSAGGILQASSNTRVVAKLIVKLLKYLMQKRNLHREMIHLIGHSLGAHIAAYIGKEIPLIPRLTALDPAQPAFEGFAKEIRLDKTDAEFVEVIHTNAKPFIPSLGFGLVKPHGHVDFYFNDGANQPGCSVPDDIPQIRNLRDLMKFSVEYDINRFGCSHSRAHEYLIEAYRKPNDCIFWGHRATAQINTNLIGDTPGQYTNFTLDSPVCTEETCIPFGLNTIESPLRGVFVVMTNSHPPYCVVEPGLNGETDS